MLTAPPQDQNASTDTTSSSPPPSAELRPPDGIDLFEKARSFLNSPQVVHKDATVDLLARHPECWVDARADPHVAEAAYKILDISATSEGGVGPEAATQGGRKPSTCTPVRYPTTRRWWRYYAQL